jgi:hypothetical protein
MESTENKPHKHGSMELSQAAKRSPELKWCFRKLRNNHQNPNEAFASCETATGTQTELSQAAKQPPEPRWSFRKLRKRHQNTNGAFASCETATRPSNGTFASCETAKQLKF